MKTFGFLVLAWLIGIPLAAYTAWVAIMLWQWFVTPFIGMQPPGLWQMAGLFVLVRLTHNWAVKTNADDIDGAGGKILFGVIMSLLISTMALASGFIFKMLAA